MFIRFERTRSDAPQWASMDARHSFHATMVRWRHTFFSTATDALMASASSDPATCSFGQTAAHYGHTLQLTELKQVWQYWKRRGIGPTAAAEDVSHWIQGVLVRRLHLDLLEQGRVVGRQGRFLLRDGGLARPDLSLRARAMKDQQRLFASMRGVDASAEDDHDAQHDEAHHIAVCTPLVLSSTRTVGTLRDYGG